MVRFTLLWRFSTTSAISWLVMVSSLSVVVIIALVIALLSQLSRVATDNRLTKMSAGLSRRGISLTGVSSLVASLPRRNHGRP